MPFLVESKESCCGCGACFAACPVKAISMQADEEGFLYPSIDETKCIDCKKCIRVCAFKAAQKEKGIIC